MTIEEKYQQIPPALKAWFGSEEVDDAILAIEIGHKLSSSEIAIPRLLFQVETKDLPVTGFAQALAERLNISLDAAQLIYEDVRSEILLPVRDELTAWGVDTSSFPAPAVKLPAPGVLPQPYIPEASTQTVTLPTRPTSTLGTPAPVAIYRDSLSSQSVVQTPRFGSIGSDSGDISNRAFSTNPTVRPARIDLGVGSTRVDDALKSIFVQRETPKVQAIDYGASHPTSAAPISQPVSLGAVPAPQSPITPPPTFTPSVEVVNVPLKDKSEPATEGFMDSIMQRIAPWHHAKFDAARNHPSEALEVPVPSREINYSAEPVVTEHPVPTPVGAVSISDLPTPPKA